MILPRGTLVEKLRVYIDESNYISKIKTTQLNLWINCIPQVYLVIVMNARYTMYIVFF